MKSTIVSLYPLEFHEYVPGLFPSLYEIPPSDGQIPQVLHVGEAFYLIEVGEDRPSVRITKSADAIANSLVQDFMTSSMHIDEEARPAIFVIHDEVDANTVLKTHGAKVQQAIKMQKNWFTKLVRLADDEWQKYRQHRVITDLFRIAARQLKLDREWLDIKTDTISCPGCGMAVNPVQALCGHCRVIINQEAYKSLKFAEAK